MTSLLKNLLILLSIIALGALGYYLFFASGDSSIVTSGGSASRAGSAAAMQSREFQRILDDLESIDLDSSLFTERDFLELRDHAQPINERSFGRPNPFSITPAIR